MSSGRFAFVGHSVKNIYILSLPVEPHLWFLIVIKITLKRLRSMMSRIRHNTGHLSENTTEDRRIDLNLLIFGPDITFWKH